MGLFLDLHQYASISEASSSASRAEKKAQEIEWIQKKQERMALVCQALLEVIQERISITDEELEEKILEVDLRDGIENGKINYDIVNCLSCGKKANSTRGFCFFCGAPTSKEHAFE